MTLVFFWVVQSFIAQPFQVRQGSMQTTLEDGQYVLIDKVTPRFDPYHRGDIIVFSPPANSGFKSGDQLIKRIVATAGDTVEIAAGRLRVNGIELTEPYLFAVDGTAEPTERHGVADHWIVPVGELFVMGDHRMVSKDSRDFGPIDVTAVIGRAWLRYWPHESFGFVPAVSYPELVNRAP